VKVSQSDPLRAAWEAHPDLLLVVDVRTGRVAESNRTGPVHGYEAGDLVGLALPYCLVAPPRAELLALLGAGVAKECPAQLRQGDGSVVAVTLRIIPAGEVAVVVVGAMTGSPVADELRRVNRFLDAIVENIPDMIFVKDANTLLFKRFNRAGEQLLGWPREQLLGKTDHDFYPKEQADFFHQKDRETLRNGALVDIPEEPIDTRHGRRWLHTKKVPVCDDDGTPLYLLGISEDITARKAAEERAGALERELAAVVQHAGEAVISWDAEGLVRSWNAGAERLFGKRASEAVGRAWADFVPTDAEEELAAAVERVLSGERVPPREVLRLRGDSEIEVEESLFLIPSPDEGGGRIGCIARDLSAMQRLRRATEILSRSDRHQKGDEAAPTSRGMEAALQTVDAVAQDPVATVLLLGETGVGKSWLAQRIHARSPRAAAPFLEINCATLAPALLESELFGHERGAFTGAQAQKRGLVEAADGGTLFLDEVGELPMSVQAQLLTFLDQRSFRRLGATRSLRADVRIIAATNVDLVKAVSRGAFRADLYYRLSVFPVRVPPLRERREELPGLTASMLADLVRRADRREASLDPGVARALAQYGWPGNLRELRNALERALILSRGGPIRLEHLPPEVVGGRPAPGTALPQRLDDLERVHIQSVLEQVRGNRTLASEILGISRSTLKRKLAELRMEGEA
jgi:two-component system response regulator HydG